MLAGRGEAIPLADAAADAVLVSSAWHWMDPAALCPRSPGSCATAAGSASSGTGRDPSITWLRPDEWFRVADAGTSAGNGSEGASLRRQRHEVALTEPALFVNIETAEFRFSRRMTTSDLVDWLMTYSRVITASEEDQGGRPGAGSCGAR